jgi:hypothetical protein
MAMIWIQCRTIEDVLRLRTFAHLGSLNGGSPMPARIAPQNPFTLDVNFGNHPVDLDRIRSFPYVEAADYFYGDEWSEDPVAELFQELTYWLRPNPAIDAQMP